MDSVPAQNTEDRLNNSGTRTWNVRPGFRASIMASALCLMVACAPDYVYIQAGKSEADVRTDYIACAEQQQLEFFSGEPEEHRIRVIQKAPSTSDCMEGKGYHAMKIEAASHPNRVPAESALPAFRSQVQ